MGLTSMRDILPKKLFMVKKHISVGEGSVESRTQVYVIHFFGDFSNQVLDESTRMIGLVTERYGFLYFWLN